MAKSKQIAELSPDGLDRWRRAERVTLEQISAKIGLSVSWLSAAFRGYRTMTAEQIEATRVAIEVILERRRRVDALAAETEEGK